jgi:hypothetical protein
MAEKNITRGVRISMENFGRGEDIDIYQLYAAGNVVKNSNAVVDLQDELCYAFSYLAA